MSQYYSQNSQSKKDRKNHFSPADLYAFEFQNPEPKYYTRIPNILDHLTYKNEKGEVKRLSVYAKELYRIIRMIASDHGCCWYTTKNLAEKIGCSAGAVCNAKKELMMQMIQLDGNPLIIEKRKSTPKIVNGIVTSRRDLCTYTLMDIWRWNNAYMATLKYQVEPEILDETDSYSESVGGTDSCGESVSQGTDSCGEPNNNKKNNIPLSLKQQPTAEADVSISSKEKDLVYGEKQVEAFNWLMKIGMKMGAAYTLVQQYSYEEIDLASAYLESQLNKKKRKGENIPNKIAYLINTLQNRYWEKVAK